MDDKTRLKQMVRNEVNAIEHAIKILEVAFGDDERMTSMLSMFKGVFENLQVNIGARWNVGEVE